MWEKMTKKQLSNKKFRSDLAKAIFEKHGILYKAVKSLDINWTNFWRWRQDDNDFDKFVSETVFEARESLKDFYEEALINLVAQGNPQAIIYANKSLNKDRGYSTEEKLNISGDITVSWGGDSED